MAMPSYTSVSARHTLARPVMHQPAPAVGEPKAKFTDAVRDWVQRAFAPENAIPGISDAEWRTKLLDYLPSVQASGAMDTIDWSTHLLPQQMIQQQRQAAALAQSMSHTNLAPFCLPSHISAAHKRKSSDLDLLDDGVDTPPGKKSKGSLEDRVTGRDKKESKKQKKAKALQNDNSVLLDSDALQRRRERFGYVSPQSSPFQSRDETPAVDTPGAVVGTCQKLEKNYFRLTSAPKPEEVRPLSVLKEAFTLIREKWKLDHNYHYTKDQLKSIRQDLTVQHFKNDFVVVVYETHARIALEQGDVGEYNMCQTQLRALYKMGLNGKRDEFTGYRILYFVFTRKQADLNDVLADLTSAEKQMRSVKHALQVHAALASGNYHRFFRLYQTAPYLGPYLLDQIVPRERVAALAKICKAYKQDVSLDFVVTELGFQAEDEDDADGPRRQCVEFIAEHNGEHLIQQKDDGAVRFLTSKAGLLFEEAKQRAFQNNVDLKGQV